MTAPYYDDGRITIWQGDCLTVLAGIADESIDAVCTDPPYGLEFMGKDWDKIDAWTPGRSPAKDASTGGFFKGDRPNFRRVFDGPAFQAWCQTWAAECLRVLKPGGHLLAFGGTRTAHRLTAGIEDAGFEIRDSIVWLYGQGFPKSLDVSKAIDRRGGRPDLAQEIAAAIREARETRGWTTSQADRHFCGGSTNWTWYEGRQAGCRPPTPATFDRIAAEWPELAPLADAVAAVAREIIGTRITGAAMSGGRIPSGVDLGTGGTDFGSGQNEVDITAPATPEAAQWQGWGTALKPAVEPITVARKPLQGTVAANVLRWGTGALNIDAARIGTGADKGIWPTTDRSNQRSSMAGPMGQAATDTSSGRWPANVALDEHTADLLDQQTGELTSGANPTRRGADSNRTAYGDFAGQDDANPQRGTDVGFASRYFKVVSSTLEPWEQPGERSTRDASTSAGRQTESTGNSSPTDGFGNSQTDPSQTDTTSTTETTTRLTTPSTTCNCSPPKRTGTTTTEAAKTTPSSMESNTDAANDATPCSHCQSLRSAEQAPTRATAETASANTSASGATGTGTATTPICAPVDRPGAMPFRYEAKASPAERISHNGVTHPTQKPLNLIRWLVRLVTPPGGRVLDLFAGSGTTAEACLLEGFACTAIEKGGPPGTDEAEYLPMIVQRLNRRRDPVAFLRAAKQELGLFDEEGQRP